MSTLTTGSLSFIIVSMRTDAGSVSQKSFLHWCSTASIWRLAFFNSHSLPESFSFVFWSSCLILVWKFVLLKTRLKKTYNVFNFLLLILMIHISSELTVKFSEFFGFLWILTVPHLFDLTWLMASQLCSFFTDFILRSFLRLNSFTK